MEAYRRIRNTSRFILGNLYDFNVDTDGVPYEQMTEMDKWALHRLQEVIKRVTEAYEGHQFHVVFYTLYNYCTVDLSALYLDVLKTDSIQPGQVSGAPLGADGNVYYFESYDPASDADSDLYRGRSMGGDARMEGKRSKCPSDSVPEGYRKICQHRYRRTLEGDD